MPVAMNLLSPAEIVATQVTAAARTDAAARVTADASAMAERALPTEAGSADAPAPPAPSSHLLGDWLSLRTALEDAGITPSASYIWMPALNLNGGTRKKAEQSGQLALGAMFDLDRLAGVKGGAFQVTFNYRHGKNINDTNDLRLLQYPQGIFGAGQIWRLTDFYYRQQLGPVEVKLGHLPMGKDFAAAQCYFASLYFCGTVPGHNSSAYWYNYPTAQWGALAKVSDRLGYTTVGIYQHNDENFPDNHGLYLGTKGGDGVVVAVERGFTVNLGGNPKRAGLYKVGAFYNNTRVADIVQDEDGGYHDLTGQPSDMFRGRRSFYVMGTQQIVPTRKDGSGGLAAFFNFNQADHRTAKVINILTAGVTYSGLFAGRPKDEIGLAVGRTRVNGRLADVIEARQQAGETGLEKQRNEYAIEGTYSFAISPALSVRPNIQWYIDPAGYHSAHDIVVLGTSVFVTL
jgi:porin